MPAPPVRRTARRLPVDPERDRVRLLRERVPLRVAQGALVGERKDAPVGIRDVVVLRNHEPRDGLRDAVLFDGHPVAAKRGNELRRRLSASVEPLRFAVNARVPGVGAVGGGLEAVSHKRERVGFGEAELRRSEEGVARADSGALTPSDETAAGIGVGPDDRTVEKAVHDDDDGIARAGAAKQSPARGVAVHRTRDRNRRTATFQHHEAVVQLFRDADEACRELAVGFDRSGRAQIVDVAPVRNVRERRGRVAGTGVRDLDADGQGLAVAVELSPEAARLREAAARRTSGQRHVAHQDGVQRRFAVVHPRRKAVPVGGGPYFHRLRGRHEGEKRQQRDCPCHSCLLSLHSTLMMNASA